MGRLGTESAFEALAWARALEATGRTIIHLRIGEPEGLNTLVTECTRLTILNSSHNPNCSASASSPPWSSR
jgi:hypothetical protein